MGSVQVTGNLSDVFRRRSGVRVRQRLRRVELWPVFKVSLAFHAICGVITLGVVTLVWQLGSNAGFTERVTNFLVDIGFAESIRFSGARLFRGASTITLGIVLHNTVVTVLLAALYNLLSGLMGGIIVNVVEDDQIRPVGRRSQAAIRPDGSARPSGAVTPPQTDERGRALGRVRRVRSKRSRSTKPTASVQVSSEQQRPGGHSSPKGLVEGGSRMGAVSLDRRAHGLPPIEDDLTTDLDDSDWLSALADDSLDEDTFGPGQR